MSLSEQKILKTVTNLYCDCTCTVSSGNVSVNFLLFVVMEFLYLDEQACTTLLFLKNVHKCFPIKCCVISNLCNSNVLTENYLFYTFNVNASFYHFRDHLASCIVLDGSDNKSFSVMNNGNYLTQPFVLFLFPNLFFNLSTPALPYKQ